MPIKGFPSSPFGLRRDKGKKDEVPPSHKIMAGQVEEWKKNLSLKSFFLT
jgi:hypothetical protein